MQCQNSIFFLLAKCANHHPHHVLPKVFALYNAFKDEEYIKDASQKSKTLSMSPRTDAAVQLVQKLKGDAGLRDIIIQMEKMCQGMCQISIVFRNAH